jgi:hypothetical protein
VTWALAADHPTWSYEGVTAWTGDELQRLRRGLDAGRPQVLGLVGARGLEELARNRQVVAYGYDDDGSGATRVYVYDGNHPDTEVVLEAAPTPRSCSPARPVGRGGGCSCRTTPASARRMSTSAPPRASG